MHLRPRVSSSRPRDGKRRRGPALTRLRCRLPTRPSHADTKGVSRRALSHRLVGGCGDHLSGLQAETGSGHAALPLGRAAPRGVSARVRGAVRQGARPAASGGRAGAPGLPHMWARRARFRARLVWDVPPDLRDPLLVSWKIVLSLLREEALPPLGGMAARRGARAGPAPPRRLHHAPAAARDIPETAGAAARSVSMRCGGTR